MNDRLRLAESLAGGDNEPFAFVLAGDIERAAKAYTSVTSAQRNNAVAWSNLAAAEYCAALSENDDSRLLSALVAVDRALSIAPRMAQARFNRALIAKQLGFRPLEIAAWRATLDVDPTSAWSDVARAKLAAVLGQRSDHEAWKSGLQSIDVATDEDLGRRVARFPQYARLYAEGPFLTEWAHAMSAGDTEKAARLLRRARRVGDKLKQQTGDALAAEEISSIDRAVAGRDKRQLNNFVAAYECYERGRTLLRDHKDRAAEEELLRAESFFAGTDSPMREVTRYFRATALLAQDRVAESSTIVDSIVESEREQGSRHRTFVAELLWEVALCHSIRGHWTASMNSSTEALQIFKALGESGNAASVEIILGEAYDYLGQPLLALKHGISAMRLASESGDDNRGRIILAGLARAEMRSGHWSEALALGRLDEEARIKAQNPVADADLYLRLATTHHRLGNAVAAERALAAAHACAQSLPDPADRQRYLAEHAGVAGAMLRTTDPPKAITLLTTAIDFERASDRPIFLPQLHLERGRAEVALAKFDEAKSDFDDGISRLEQQRGAVSDLELRPGIFDDAADLFDEAVSLALRRGDVRGAFAYVERGRGRVVLDAIEGRAGGVRQATTEAITRSVAGGGVLVEYALLDDRVAIFVVDDKGLDVKVVSAKRQTVERDVQALLSAITTRKAPDVVKKLAATMHETLLGPIRDRISDKSYIVVVPDARLQQVPFAALFDAKAGSFLVQRCAVTTSPSAAVFVHSVERQRHAPRGNPETVAVFSNPTLRPGVFGNLPALFGAEGEAARVGRAYRHATIATRAGATPKSFVDAAKTADVVHFAGHAVIYPADPSRSSLLLAANGDDDGALASRRIGAMKFPRTRLVVLAACSTLRGKSGAVEGVPSLARAFLVAGVPAVVGTLWDIDDREVGPVIDAFHARVARGETPADALRAAQLEALQSPSASLSHPASWAAFSLLGASGH